MWEPQPLTSLRASQACRGENFTFYLYKYIHTTPNNKAKDVINSNRFRWSQALNKALNTSVLETGARDKNSQDDEKVGKKTGQ
jgi:hypothetical protein